MPQKEYKSRHDWVDKVIYRELCKRLKFDHIKKWFMHEPKWLRITKSQSEDRIKCWLTKKKYLLSQRFCCSDEWKWKKDWQIFGSCQGVEKLWKHKSDRDTSCSWSVWNSTQEKMEVRERIETIQTTALFRSTRLLSRILKTRRDLLSPQWKMTS